MSSTYIGITIGPIFDTIKMTSSPAALWAASYIFSSLTKTVCKILTDEKGPYKIKCEDIVSPYYNPKEELLNRNNGVGLFHDRIVFKCDENFDVSVMKEVKETAITEIAEQFDIKNVDYLKEYIMISYAKFKADNPILGSGVILDSLELSKPFVFKEEENPILSLFINDKLTAEEEKAEDQEKPKVGKNEAVKKLVKEFEGFQLKKLTNEKGETVLKSLSDITLAANRDYKRSKYYAIVRADGDRMGKIIETLNNDESVRKFSKTCLAYCSDVAETVRKYDGVTIYSGGDDLLAILPCEKDSKTVFDFVSDANNVFNNHFRGYNKLASLSFGILIAYNRFPLYEALSESADLLFGKAKQMRNCVAVKIQKHSGQSEGLLIAKPSLQYFTNLLRSVLKEKETTLLSAMHKVSLFESQFNSARDFTTIHNLFINTFDAEAHEDNTFVHNMLPDLFKFIQDRSAEEKKQDEDENFSEKETATGEVKTTESEANDADKKEEEPISSDGMGFFRIDGKGINKTNPALTLQYVLRTLKFFIEKRGSR